MRIASNWTQQSSEQAANYAIAHGSAALAHAVVQARSKARRQFGTKPTTRSSASISPSRRRK